MGLAWVQVASCKLILSEWKGAKPCLSENFCSQVQFQQIYERKLGAEFHNVSLLLHIWFFFSCISYQDLQSWSFLLNEVDTKKSKEVHMSTIFGENCSFFHLTLAEVSYSLEPQMKTSSTTCVSPTSQPLNFNHSLLKNHTIQMSQSVLNSSSGLKTSLSLVYVCTHHFNSHQTSNLFSLGQLPS